MITVICSSIEPQEDFKKHVIKTSGLKDIEFIAFENKGTNSLTELYNKGLAQAKNDIVVFLHDDIKIKTNKWGKRLLDHFNNTDYGILGVAGTYNFPESGTWWENRHTMVGIVNHKHPETKKEYESKFSAPLGNEIAPVATLDGVFFAAHKDRIKAGFDETIPGFHFYDISFCLANHTKDVKLGVFTNIRIVHDSIGQTNSQWGENKKLVLEKWIDELPATVDDTIITYNKLPIKLKTTPKISILILSKSANRILFKCIDSFLEKSTYTNYEIIVGDTGSKNEVISEFIDKYQDYDNIKLVPVGDYHFGKNNNELVTKHVAEDSELLLFCNNDIELINDVLTQLTKSYIDNQHSVGTIGTRLYYPNNTIQHSAIAPYLKKEKIYIVKIGAGSRYSYINGTKEVFSNTAALCLVNKKVFIKAGMFSTEFQECYEDVDMNINLINMGRKNMIAGDAIAYHIEGQTRFKVDGREERELDDLKVITQKLIDNNKTHKYVIRL
jgi:GT2 family glycosyltransferase